jgi:archaemetzincin
MGNGDDTIPQWGKSLCAIPLAEIDAAFVGAIAAEAGSLLGLSFVLSPALGLEESAYDPRRRQYSATRLLESLRPCARKGMLHLAITDVDLFYPGLNCVYGLADDVCPVAVVSTARLARNAGTALPGGNRTAERTVKTAIHELGHLVGLSHCGDHRCVMFFSFNLKDTDHKSKEFCRACAKTFEAGLRAYCPPAERA